MSELLCSVLGAYSVVIIVRALFSWFPTQPGSGLDQVREVLHRVTDPVLLPIRNLMGSSLGGIDISPIVALIGIRLLMGAIC